MAQFGEEIRDEVKKAPDNWRLIFYLLLAAICIIGPLYLNGERQQKNELRAQVTRQAARIDVLEAKVDSCNSKTQQMASDYEQWKFDFINTRYVALEAKDRQANQQDAITDKIISKQQKDLKK